MIAPPRFKIDAEADYAVVQVAHLGRLPPVASLAVVGHGIGSQEQDANRPTQGTGRHATRAACPNESIVFDHARSLCCSASSDHASHMPEASRRHGGIIADRMLFQVRDASLDIGNQSFSQAAADAMPHYNPLNCGRLAVWRQGVGRHLPASDLQPLSQLEQRKSRPHVIFNFQQTVGMPSPPPWTTSNGSIAAILSAR